MLPRSGRTTKVTFLSTLSLRRATPGGLERIIWRIISIHALLAESDAGCFAGHHAYTISIHALLAESDLGLHILDHLRSIFLSTLSLRRATDNLNTDRTPTQFLSTLSLRRATRKLRALLVRILNFYPRSPCGERPDDMVQAQEF